MTSKLPELYIAVDVEADGPIPGPYSMLALGMAVVGHPSLCFYSELRPISTEFVPAALAVSGLDRERLLREAPAPEDAMRAAASWVNSLRKLGRPVFLAAPAVWDGMFVHWYFLRYVGKSPFGTTGSGIDLRSYWMGLHGIEWVATRKGVHQERARAGRRRAHASCGRRRPRARGGLRGRPGAWRPARQSVRQRRAIGVSETSA